MRKYLLLLCLVGVSTMFAVSQSTSTFTINASPSEPFACSYSPAMPYCWGLPITDNSTGAQGKLWLLNGNLEFMGGYEGLGQAVYTSNDGLGHITFEGTGYTGAIDFTYFTYLCGKWHNQHCWAITGGSVTITKQ